MPQDDGFASVATAFVSIVDGYFSYHQFLHPQRLHPNECLKTIIADKKFLRGACLFDLT
jgi:hypothetical protein